MCSSSAWLPARPVTASHSSPDSRSSTEVSSKNARTCSSCCSSTSSARKSRTYRWLPVNAATNPATSSWPRSDNPASRSPAAHPSVRSASAATAASGNSMPGPAATPASSPAASPAVNRRSAARTSASCPRARNRASGIGGSARLARTTPSPGGRCSSKNPSDAWTGAQCTTW